MPDKEKYPKAVKQFLNKYYEEYGVGRTEKQRLAHWKKKLEEQKIQGPTFKEGDLSALEVSHLLAEEFPDIWPES